MSWLSSFWKHNRNFIGNAMKNVAPAAFLIPGVGPLAAAGIAGVGGALGRGIQEGGNLGNILKTGLTDASLAYTGSRLTDPTKTGQSLQRLRGLFSGGGNASPAAQSARTAVQQLGVPADTVTPSSRVLAAVPGVTPAPLPADAYQAAQTALGRLGQGARTIGAFAKDNAMASAMALQGAGQLASAPAEARLKRAQQESIELDNEEKRREAERQQRLAEALGPLIAMMTGQLQQRLQQPPPRSYY